LFLLVILLTSSLSPAAMAQSSPQRRSFIRDAEVENTIRTYATPLFQAAGLDPEAVRIHLLVDQTLNAFVAGGQNMFFHTGLLIRTENPNQLIGVIAHESGHIAGGHLIRATEAASNISTEALIGMLLGAAAGAASGRGDVIGATMLGANHLATRSMLAFTRSQEQQADQMAMRFLDSTHQSAKGMLQFFDVLGDQELLVASRQDPYVQTHPLTRDRVAFVREHVEHSPYNNEPTPPQWAEMHRRMRAKLFAFLEPPVRTFQRYKETDTSIEARYARAIALYRKPDVEAAVQAIDGLIKERPKDPYFWEMKGQILFENGRGADAVAPYRKAVELLPDNALLLAELGTCEVETEDPDLLKDAEKNLSAAVRREPDDAMTWQRLGTAFSRDGNEGMASYALAEHLLLLGKLPEANYHAGRAEQLLGKTGPIWLRIQDIKEAAAQAQEIRSRR
jgi:predicted Zn-dependent protease